MEHTFFIMRHGQSVGNINKLISSRFTDDLFDPPLTDHGRSEVQMSCQAFLKMNTVSSIELISSPFLRARQTAEIFARFVELDYRVDWRLRERDFGIYDRMSDKNYDVIWKNDENGNTSDEYLVEPVKSVLHRIRSLIDDLTVTSEAETILLFTHGDVASISIAGFSQQNLALHRKVGALQTAEIRYLTNKSLTSHAP